jgi:hypothetical protein
MEKITTKMISMNLPKKNWIMKKTKLKIKIT